MAAPTFVTSGGFTQGATAADNTKTESLDLSAAGTLDFLVAHVGWVDATLQSVSSVSYNGVNLTECAGSEVTNDATAVSRGVMGVGLWGLVNPYTGGAANLIVTMDGGQPTRMMIGYSVWNGVDATTPFGTPNTNTQEGTSATFTVDPATTADDVALGSMVASSDAATDVSAGGNELFDVNEQSSFGTDHTGQYLAHDVSSPTTLTWTKALTRQCAGVGVALQGAAGAAADAVPQVWMQYRARTIH